MACALLYLRAAGLAGTGNAGAKGFCMFGRIYTFERAPTCDAREIRLAISPMVLRAITLAMYGRPRVRFEELTDFDNPHPIVVVLFERMDHVSGFDQQLRKSLATYGIAVRAMRATIGHAARTADADP